MKFFEIGFGCDPNSGPGPSYHLWKDVLGAKAEIWMAEINEDCVEKFKSSITGVHMLFGAQVGSAVVDKWIAESKSGFDIIVDDGGHRNEDILNTLKAFWPGLKSGGLYFIEDLQYGT